ncbi:hypothetical protein [Cylindrospermum stagnale]|uniref:hypothetical protein n=1 Tax=Cylindrospermum stagnale TaxID=142864 RepID=UPI0002EC31C6|nr:hypothetical protein [Cylindrospermum stagnale]
MTEFNVINFNYWLIFSNLISPDPAKSVQYTGDNLTGVGDGDDIIIKMNLEKKV